MDESIALASSLVVGTFVLSVNTLMSANKFSEVQMYKTPWISNSRGFYLF